MDSGIPRYPDFKPLVIEDRPVIQKRFRAFAPETSELTFTNLFMWRPRYLFRWSIDGDYLLICAFDRNDWYGLPPVGPPPRRPKAELLFSWLARRNGRENNSIGRADERLAAEFAGDDRYRIVPAPEHFDYVYKTEDLAFLRGNKYHAKRNHISALLRTGRFMYHPIDSGIIESCVDFAGQWCSKRKCQSTPDGCPDCIANRECLRHFDSLGIVGGCIEHGGKVRALTAAEELNPHTAVIHIEIADQEFPGLYPLINREFCANALRKYMYVNREQDLGDPGLRKAKQSYHPVDFVKKYSVTQLG